VIVSTLMMTENLSYSPELEGYRQGYNAKTLALDIIDQILRDNLEEAKNILNKTRKNVVNNARGHQKISLVTLQAAGLIPELFEGDMIVDIRQVKKAKNIVIASRDMDIENFEKVGGLPLDQNAEDFIASLSR